MEKTRKEELLTKMTALTGGERNNLDIFCTHEKIVNFIIRNTFDTPDRRGKTVKYTLEEVLDLYSVESKRHELDLQREIQDFAQDVSDHEYMREILWEATKTETKIMLKLINFANSCDGRVIFDRHLKVNGKSRWFEAVLVTQEFIMLLKHHMPSHDVCITEEGKLCWLDVSTVELAQVSIQNELRKQLLLMRMILDNSDVCHRICAALIVGGTHEFNSIFDDRELCFGRLEDMEKKISFAPRGDIFDEVTMQIIKQIIETWKVEEKKEPISKEYDLIEAYCYLKERM